jgi:GTP pyrophosphokinase
LHSQIGHRCIGAKVNNNIIPLTYTLKTGDRVEILTTKKEHPSRDWLIPNLGFLHSPRSRSKVLHWFKKQDQEKNILLGHDLINKETKRASLSKIDLKEACEKLHYKTTEDLLAALGGGELKINAILNALGIQVKKPLLEAENGIPKNSPKIKRSKKNSSDFNIQDAGNVLAYSASCCKPIPGEKIIGYITKGKGIAVHRDNCLNVLDKKKFRSERFISASWDKKIENKYPVDIVITSFHRQGLVRDITSIIADAGLLIMGLDLAIDKKERIAEVKIGLEISGLRLLNNILSKIQKLSGVIDAYRK